MFSSWKAISGEFVQEFAVERFYISRKSSQNLVLVESYENDESQKRMKKWDSFFVRMEHDILHISDESSVSIENASGFNN